MTISLSPAKSNCRPVACDSCCLNIFCLPVDFEDQDDTHVHELHIRNGSIAKGEYLYQAGETDAMLYAVRSGCVKTSIISSTGQEHITGFSLPGEFVGLGSLTSPAYTTNAEALETTHYCATSFERISALTKQAPGFTQHLFAKLTEEISKGENTAIMLSQKSAEQRLASFLVNLSYRFQLRGFSPVEFKISMSRNDIGKYLGLAVETVSRHFTRFQKQQLIETNGRFVKLIAPEQLQSIAGLTQRHKLGD